MSKQASLRVTLGLLAGVFTGVTSSPAKAEEGIITVLRTTSLQANYPFVSSVVYRTPNMESCLQQANLAGFGTSAFRASVICTAPSGEVRGRSCTSISSCTDSPTAPAPR